MLADLREAVHAVAGKPALNSSGDREGLAADQEVRAFEHRVLDGPPEEQIDVIFLPHDAERCDPGTQDPPAVRGAPQRRPGVGLALEELLRIRPVEAEMIVRVDQPRQDGKCAQVDRAVRRGSVAGSVRGDGADQAVLDVNDRVVDGRPTGPVDQATAAQCDLQGVPSGARERCRPDSTAARMTSSALRKCSASRRSAPSPSCRRRASMICRCCMWWRTAVSRS